jgi:hypothetical protein
MSDQSSNEHLLGWLEIALKFIKRVESTNSSELAVGPGFEMGVDAGGRRWW